MFNWFNKFLYHLEGILVWIGGGIVDYFSEVAKIYQPNKFGQNFTSPQQTFVQYEKKKTKCCKGTATTGCCQNQEMKVYGPVPVAEPTEDEIRLEAYYHWEDAVRNNELTYGRDKAFWELAKETLKTKKILGNVDKSSLRLGYRVKEEIGECEIDPCITLFSERNELSKKIDMGLAASDEVEIIHSIHPGIKSIPLPNEYQIPEDKIDSRVITAMHICNADMRSPLPSLGASTLLMEFSNLY
jgi:hypothetical protein